MEVIQAEIPCIISGEHEAVVACERDRHGQPLRTVISRRSGLVYTDPRPSHESVRQFYREDYRSEYKGSRIPKMKHIYRAGRVALSRWHGIREHVPHGAKVLDAGAGGGELMCLLRHCGHQVHGIEPNIGYAEYAREQYGLDLDVCFFEDASLEPESFDAIVLFHVLEHLENPLLEIQRLRRFLKPGGKFIIEVPNVMYTRCFPAAKWHIGHLYNFNTVTLAAVAVQAGLEVVKVEALGDGGNVRGVFVNNDPVEAYCLDGNFQAVHQRLESHSVAGHLFSPHPYIRPLKKILRSTREKIATRGCGNGQQLLENLFRGVAG